MDTGLEQWQRHNLAVLREALDEALIVRVIRRCGEQRLIDVGQARALDHEGYRGILTLRDLADRSRRALELADITAVEIIGVYLKDYEPGQPAGEE
ncbi:hypothetical protein [Corynebacterium halotolerans]|uniref:Uncharacterized protein n=1 Tax=Corynebacterium halotolerans YIM 70093 = DSM 44683 TaxID=1121362 RepID=M1MWP9_9CORY|nr:hypothetical protein [Corynebacterium halotolerans]AGF72169.1 hypothetical protein A605_05815 [Corynebacterium halotolerans YIM 70093 = DSM 44683]